MNSYRAASRQTNAAGGKIVVQLNNRNTIGLGNLYVARRRAQRVVHIQTCHRGLDRIRAAHTLGSVYHQTTTGNHVYTGVTTIYDPTSAAVQIDRIHIRTGGGQRTKRNVAGRINIDQIITRVQNRTVGHGNPGRRRNLNLSRSGGDITVNTKDHITAGNRVQFNLAVHR